MAENSGVVVLVDQQGFRRATVKEFLGDWAEQNHIEIEALPPDGLLKALEAAHGCRMIIFSLGGSSITIPEVSQRIRIARALVPDAVVAILSDLDGAEEVKAALRVGVDGYLPSNMRPELVVQALSFILSGGSFFPPSAMREGAMQDGSSSGSAVENGSPPPDGGRQPGGSNSETSGGERGAHENKNGEVVRPGQASELPAMTGRQQEVLDLLRGGEPNKVIARRLGMTEATVKVHVRQIMRKLGVSNRTQAAVVAASMLGEGDEVRPCENDRARGKVETFRLEGERAIEPSGYVPNGGHA